MYHLQLIACDALMAAASAYSQACKEVLDAQVAAIDNVTKAQSETEPSGARPGAKTDGAEQSDSTARANAFEMPALPEKAKSWYRAPYENPFVAFWDQMQRPWRAFVPDQWSALSMPGATGAFGSSPFGWPQMGGAFGQADMMHAWLSLAAAAWKVPAMPGGGGYSAVPGLMPGMMPVAKGNVAEPGQWPVMAVAKVVFQDQSEITITIPCAPPFGLPVGTPPKL